MAKRFTPEQFETLFGRTADLASKLKARDGKTSDGTVGAWKSRGQIPALRVLDVSAATGIPPYRIRPDLYPAPEMQGAH